MCTTKQTISRIREPVLRPAQKKTAVPVLSLSVSASGSGVSNGKQLASSLYQQKEQEQ
jgi:hypothetical protein